MMRTLFLQAPSFDGYDGGAGRALSDEARGQVLLVSDLAWLNPPRWSKDPN